ncbi:MAG: 1-acyl-sn-glycerol-3-phosphate acyltransferase [Flavobacteriales bacterium]|nr:1-acyl-sn-glycerol-3-phosphate acyltransferase [Flavobacteriales bacterium]
MRSINAFLLKLLGWRIVGGKPANVRQFIVVVAPHTSNWDFPIGLLVRSVVGMTDVKYLAKKELFTPWIGWIFRALGGYPVDRKKHTNMTEAVVDLFHRNPDFKIAITPEGTRKYVPEWKTGFHRIAILANVPIILCSFDFGTKTVTFSDVFPLSGNVAEDIEAMKAIFRKAKGRNPDQGIL